MNGAGGGEERKTRGSFIREILICLPGDCDSLAILHYYYINPPQNYVDDNYYDHHHQQQQRGIDAMRRKGAIKKKLTIAAVRQQLAISPDVGKWMQSGVFNNNNKI